MKNVWELGEWVDARYEIRHAVAAGAMGAVFQALDHTTGAHVAIKALLGRDSDALRERFAREASMLSTVHHPNVVRFVAHGVDKARDLPWLAMEFVEGESLEAALLRRGTYPWRMAVSIAIDVLEALGAVHSVGLVHRDVKPANIALEKSSGLLKLLDLGIARPSDSARRLTATGATMGTPAYMAPEQLMGAPGASSDVYSACLVLYELIAGAIPFANRGAQALLPRLVGEEVPVFAEHARCPPALLKLLRAVLVPDADRRPALEHVVGELRAVLEANREGHTAWAQLPTADAPHRDVAPRPPPPKTLGERWLVVLRSPRAEGTLREQAEQIRGALPGIELYPLDDDTLLALTTNRPQCDDLCAAFRSTPNLQEIRYQVASNLRITPEMTSGAAPLPAIAMGLLRGLDL